ncbi:ABC transporter permease/M1 family aminopeptidase [Xanthovirga aplysinae]|uniref:ABC transporter permease/M1 family aminopeptidase n=1 Tax=Xanthovirga aplysinae TaxID=2529853 RepID=UPI0012BD55F9|nr:M1 family aminopeptidase [Xanthovirga aplysinae]MTI31906.1 peptidase M1 [Xanthovirga aplysinae]
MWYEILKFELQYRAKRPDTYIYFFILFLYSILAVDFLFEGELAPLKRNAPIVIARTMGIVSALFMMIISMIMGVAVLRDFDHQMESLLFINPIKKRDYLLGRFLGSFLVLVFIFSGLLFGMILGDFMPWHDAEKMLPFNFWHYFQPFLYLIVPTLFFGGAIFFVSGALNRKLLVVYTQGFLFLMAYLLAMNLAKGSDDLFVTALIEPFTFQSIRVFTKFWTVIERNSLMIPVEGVLLYNRLLWVGMGIVALVVGYFGFSFNVVRGKGFKKQLKVTPNVENSSGQEMTNIQIPAVSLQEGVKSNLQQLLQHALFNFKSIVKEVPFWAIVLCGMGILLISSFNLGTSFGVDSYPTTYILIGELVELTVIFFLSIIVFYSGELVWKERNAKLNGIYDALPVSGFISLAGKFIGLIFIEVVLILSLILAGVFFQTSRGYYQYELGVYFIGFFVEVFPFLFLLTIICFFIQTLVNHKFIGHMVVVILVFASTILLKVLGVDHGLYTFGGADLGTYSDMNGYGHFLEPYLWFKGYWIAFSFLLFLIAVLVSVRGAETQLNKRMKLFRQRLGKPMFKAGAVAVAIFILSGGYIFYNTNILNNYSSPASEEAHRVDYEKTLKHLEYIPQPKIVDVNLKLDLYPYERDYAAEGYYILTNTHDMPVDEIHIQILPNEQVQIEYLDFEGGATVNSDYERFRYKIYTLNKPLQPGDSLKMEFKQTFTTQGFTESRDTHLVYNGTFLDNFHFPTIGYNEDIELEDEDVRKRNRLEPKIRRAKRDDRIAVLGGRSGGDGEEINFEMVIGTDSSQIAIAPGNLQREWVAGNRHYFHYKMDKPMSNFYSIVSARYEVMKDQWVPAHDSLGSPVDLEIYYHKGHEYNLDRMMKGMKKSLDYYTQHFAPYQYRQMRIMETPVYKDRAQSFPNTIPFSEGIGFIMDIDDEKDVDMAFYVTAHEMAHQWWGHQVNPANVQGMSMLSETLAQYSALMVLKQEYPEERVQQLLQFHRNRYLKGRTREKVQEMPLALVESGQDYIHYGKGLINLYAFQDYISENSVNIALSRFLRDWDSFHGLKKTKTDRYPTTIDLLGYFREVTSDSLQYLISDLFENVTLYENKTTDATFEKLSKDQFKVSLSLNVKKFRLDSLGVEKNMGLDDWVDVGIYGEGKNGEEELIYLKKHKITDQLAELEIIVDREPVRGGIDPLGKFMDRDVEDNLRGF